MPLADDMRNAIYSLVDCVSGDNMRTLHRQQELLLVVAAAMDRHEAKGVAFEEVLIPLRRCGRQSECSRSSHQRQGAVLSSCDLTVWESLSILEYLHDRFPRWGFWPADDRARAHARSVASEMHGGFSASAIIAQ